MRAHRRRAARNLATSPKKSSPAVKIVVLTGDKAANLAFTRYTDSRLLWYDVHTE
jgi:hypothetical protein